MTEEVFKFKEIARRLNRQEQKAEFDKANPEPVPATYGWPFGVAMPLSSQAHPEWPYAGTGYEWRKFTNSGS